MSIIDAIKGERKMSLGHWRYRILHWCFGEKQSEQSKNLPQFLYTHYCPLFHLTNFIAILLPLIFFLKVTYYVFKASLKLAKDINYAPLFKRFKKKERSGVDEENSKAAKVNDAKLFLRYLCKNIDKICDNPEEDFDWLYDRFTYAYCRDLSIEEAKKIFDNNITKILQAYKDRIDREKRMKEMLTKIINFSSVFFKWGLNLFYICLAIAVIWGSCVIAAPIYRGVVWIILSIISFNPIPMFLLVGKFLLIIGIVAVIAPFLLKVPHFLWNKTADAIERSLIPATIFGELFSTFAKCVSSSVTNILQFAAMFYENNCPPITIVSDEDEEIESAVGE